MEKMKSLSEFPNREWARSGLVLNYCEKLSQEIQLTVLREVYCKIGKRWGKHFNCKCVDTYSQENEPGSHQTP